MAVRWRRSGRIGFVLAAFVILCLVHEDKERSLTSSRIRRNKRIQPKVGRTEARALSEGDEGSSEEKEQEHGEKAEESPEGEDGKTESDEGEGEGEGEGQNEEEDALKEQDLTLAISLLGGVVLIMTLYYAVNYEDEDMKYYVWSVLSTFMSIFIAVFSFSSVEMLLESVVLEPHEKLDLKNAVLGFAQMAAYFSLVQVSIPLIAGVWSPPFQESEKQWEEAVQAKKREDEEYDETVMRLVQDEKEKRTAKFKSVATLLAHTCAFAAINFGGDLQHMPPFNGSLFMRFMVPPLMFLAQVGIGRICRLFRLKQIESLRRQPSYEALVHQDSDKSALYAREGRDWSLKMWDEETYECEVEIASISISFLLVQACRFSITGVMPNTMGVEEEDYYHPQPSVYQLLGLSGLFASLCVVCVFSMLHCLPTHISRGTGMSMVRRCIQVSGKTAAVACAWCILFSGRWQVAIWFPHFPPNGIISRVILAIATSGVTFFIVVLLDALADHEATDDSVDEAIFALIEAFSFLVGFSWEQSFDGAVEVLSDDLFTGYKAAGVLGLTIVVIIIVYPAWRKYILHKMIKHKVAWQHRQHKRGSVVDGSACRGSVNRGSETNSMSWISERPD